MKLTLKVVLAAILIIAVSAGIAFAVTTAAERSLARGNDLYQQAIEAQNNKRPDQRDQLLKDAVKSYNQALGGGGFLFFRKSSDTVEAAQAELGIAKSQEMMGITTKDQHKAESQAMMTYKSIVSKYDKPEQQLEDKYGSRAPVVQQVASEAKEREAALKDEVAARNQQNPLYKLMDFLVNLTGARPWLSYWLAIIIITVAVKILITPLTKAQFKSMREMQRIQPLVKDLQAKYKGNQQELGAKMMELYKEHGINPIAGCLPLLVQFPIMYLLYYIIRLYEYQFAQGMFLWINPSWGAKLPGWIGSNLSQPDMILVVLYTISMIISMRLSNVDPTQEAQQKMMSLYMPILFAFIFKGFPSAFLLYWLVFNILTTVQQYHIIHGHQEPITATATAGTGSTEPVKPAQPSQGSGGSGGSRVRSRRRRR